MTDLSILDKDRNVSAITCLINFFGGTDQLFQGFMDSTSGSPVLVEKHFDNGHPWAPASESCKQEFLLHLSLYAFNVFLLFG